MNGSYLKKQSFFLFLLVILLVMPWGKSVKAVENFDRSQYIYDSAHLLTDGEATELQNLASELGKERETAFIILTLNGTDGKELIQYVEDFYDENGPGYDQPFGNTAILAIDMQGRDLYLAGFKKAEQYLDDGRLNQVRDEITPDLSAGNYFQAFSGFINKSYDLMGIEPSGGSDGYTGSGPGSDPYGGGYNSNNGSNDLATNPENIFFLWWFQLIVALIVAAVTVGLMIYRSGGRITVNARTYMDENKSGILNKYDHFVRQTVTKVRKPSNNSRGGGGGVTGGGHSHSGSSGKF